MNRDFFFYYIVLLYTICIIHTVYSNVDESTGEEGPRKGGTGGMRKKRRTKGGGGMGGCAHIWRPDNLPGKCFGLKPHNEYEDLKDIKIVKSYQECRSLCCVLGEQCITWQYQNATTKCTLGPAVRLGLEGADTPNWCDPLPPGKWTGHRLKARNADGTCEWGSELTTQCFGLGPEKLGQGNSKLSVDQCRQNCCNDLSCEVFQEMPSRGCYYNEGKSVWCSNAETEFMGGRKCVPGFCGGMEKEILGKKKDK